MDLPDWDDVGYDRPDLFEMSKRITSETFRHKFLEHNRTWLIEQLPTILTPRTMRKSRPFLKNQLAKIIQAFNSDISSDSDDDDNRVTNFDTPELSDPSKKLVKFWLAKAKRRLKLKEVVQPLIERAKGGYCECCLSKKNLRVQSKISIDEL